MQAIRFHEHGDPAEVLRLEDVPRPEPRTGQVLVRMQASPINPSDVLFIEGRYGQLPKLPATPGFEGVGIVEASGGGLMGKLLVGKRVVPLNRRGGNWAEYAVVPATQAIPVSSALSLEEAATFFVNPAAVVVMTRKILAVPRGDWLLQSAAASSLGTMVIRLGRKVGFRTLNIVRRESQVDELKGLGADEVLVFDAASDDPEELIDRVRRLTDGGVRYAIDPVGGVVGSAMVRCLTSRGCLLTYGTLTDDSLSIPPRDLIGQQSRVEGFWLGRWMDDQSLLKKVSLIREVSGLIQAGVLTSDVSARVAFGDIPSTISQTHSGKTLIMIGGR